MVWNTIANIKPVLKSQEEIVHIGEKKYAIYLFI